jgi:hypothetical protein
MERVVTEIWMKRLYLLTLDMTQHGFRYTAPPRPRVAKPQRGKEVDRRRFGTAVVHRDLDQDVLGGRFGVLHKHVEVAIVVEHAGVEELVFQLIARPPSVRLYQIQIRERVLRVLVEILHVRVSGSAIEIEVVLLDVLAVIAFRVGEAEQPLLQNWIALVPEREREAQPLLVVAQSGDAVFAPAIRARSRVVVREVVPGIAVLAVVLTHRAPLPLAEIRSPFSPWRALLARLSQSRLFGVLSARALGLSAIS